MKLPVQPESEKQIFKCVDSINRFGCVLCNFLNSFTLHMCSNNTIYTILVDSLELAN